MARLGAPPQTPAIPPAKTPFSDHLVKSYASFSLSDAVSSFGLTLSSRRFLAPKPHQPPQWLTDALKFGQSLAVVSEKARSEFIVAPVLLTMREMTQRRLTIHSGIALNLAPHLGLQGVLDFAVAAGPALPILQAPVFVVVEAKKHDLEEGLGQCAAEMVAIQRLNARDNVVFHHVFGSVTNGREWLFLRLADTDLTIDPETLLIQDLPSILGRLEGIVDAAKVLWETVEVPV